jgi:hypothetical protein
MSNENKLPTPYESAQAKNAVNKYGVPDPETIAAIEAHTEAHTKALREENERLAKENRGLKARIKLGIARINGLKDDVKHLNHIIKTGESDD